MNLPGYFLADLPTEASLTPAMIKEACETLRRNRARSLAQRSTEEVIHVLSGVADNWLNPDYVFRKLALDQGPALTGFSRPTLSGGLDAFFEQITPGTLRELLHQDLGHPDRLDGFVTAEREDPSRLALARGPELLVHVAAGNLPNATLLTILFGVLLRSAQFVKCATGAVFLPRLFAHSLYDADPKLASCLEIAGWPGGNLALEEALFAEAGCLTVTGSDATVDEIRNRVPGPVRFVGYRHRVSFAFVSRDVLSGTSAARKIASLAAEDVAAWNQLGCLSPQAIYVEQGGAVTPDEFGGLMAEELARREMIEPRGPLPVEESAAISARRGLYQVRASASEQTRLWCSEASTAWTVVYETDPSFPFSVLNRFIHVKAAAHFQEMLLAAETVRGQVSTVGLALPPDLARDAATRLANWGVPRVCPLGRMQRPPITWRHDGRPALGDLVSWTDWER